MRRYEDGCGAAHALELVGERWALLILRELMLGPRRFTDLVASLPGISPNVLTQRLEELEAAAILRRIRLPPPAAVRAYALTDWGAELEPVIREIGRWAARSPSKRPGPMSVASLVLSFRTMFSAERAGALEAVLGLRIAGQDFTARVAGGRLAVTPGQAEAPEAVLEGGPDAMAAVAYGGQALDAALAEGSLAVIGDTLPVRSFLALFPLPEKAPTPDASAGTHAPDRPPAPASRARRTPARAAPAPGSHHPGGRPRRPGTASR